MLLLANSFKLNPLVRRARREGGTASVPSLRSGLFWANGDSVLFFRRILYAAAIYSRKSSAVWTFVFSPRTLTPKTRENREGLFPLAEMNKRCCRQNGVGAQALPIAARAKPLYGICAAAFLF